MIELPREVGNYQVLERIGSGAMASVYRVRHLQLGVDLALKVLDGAGVRLQDRLLREGRVQATLRHPNIVSVTDVIELDGMPGLVMEYIAGPTLSEHILARHPIPIDEIDRLAQAILKGVRAAHQAGHLHRDLKPANILLQPLDGELVPKIADFGLVKVLGDPESPTQTRTGQLLGSPAYMAPEQTMSAAHLDQRADVWALGAVFYQLITNRLAFPQRDLFTVFSQVRSGDFRDPRLLREGVPDRMWEAVLGAMTVDPAARIPDCDAMLRVWRGEERFVPSATISSTDTLIADSFTGEEPIAPAPAAPPAPTPRRLPRAAWALGGMALALALVVTGATLARRDAPPTSSAPEPSPTTGTHDGPAPSPIPAPTPPEPPEPAPVAPAPVATPDPVPAPASIPPPAPGPARPVPVPDLAPRPVDAKPSDPVPPTEPAPGRFTLTGHAEAAWLVRDGTYHDPGDVPPGTYTLAARFPGRPLAPVEGVTIRVKAGEQVTVDCVAGFFTCRVRQD